eukprot:m.217958 g.217958  ORF g.217958 m.217958 type:complete len:55 (+) comp39885_c0_seq6:1009-1173(+)
MMSSHFWSWVRIFTKTIVVMLRIAVFLPLALWSPARILKELLSREDAMALDQTK